MKKLNRLFRQAAVAVGLLVAGVTQSSAQVDMNKFHAIVDWQVNSPLSNDFTEKMSGWGMNFEVLYDVHPNVGLGGFMSYHTNHKYVGRETLSLSSTEALTTDQQRSAFQLPFGLSAAFPLVNNLIAKPYLGVKTGAMYAQYTTYFGTGGVQHDSWGYYVSPEFGVRIHPTGQHWGLHIAGYYSYATNHVQTLTGEIKDLHNLGFRLGVIF